MRTRPFISTVLALTAGIALFAAPRLMPTAGAAPVIAPPDLAEVPNPDVSVSDLDERDAVAAVTVDEEPTIAELTVKQPPPAKTRSRDVDVVIALDTSGSMEGLLDSARARLWDIVNEVGEREPDARLRVGLVTFGSPGVAGPHEGFVKVRTNLTTDLDSLYAEVMALHTDGGEEYVGWTLHRSVSDINWSTQKGAARILFIAGNESADQGRGEHDFRSVAMQAKERGIVINSMFAGNREQGMREGWNEVARVGGGFYTAIDQAAGTYQIEAPQDSRLSELNVRLNETYRGYGSQGAEGKANQMAQDGNAGRMGAASVSTRISAKSKNAYDNSRWDIVDAVEKGTLDVSAAAPAALPTEMQSMDAEARVEYVEELAEEREQIQAEIDKVSKERKKFIQRKRAEAPSEADSLDDAMIEALDEQL